MRNKILLLTSLFAVGLILLFCTPKSPNLSQQERVMISIQDVLDWAQFTRVSVLRETLAAHEAGEVTDEFRERVRVLGNEVERAQRTAVEAYRSYLNVSAAGDADLEDSAKFKMLAATEELRRLVLSLHQLWTNHPTPDPGQAALDKASQRMIVPPTNLRIKEITQ